ncbi:helix-turn-helix domain-containing protein [Miltoncostaea oceani]|uniref:helix-turn-helix domain-containing protein n=1 Tax=Miltoncostaea oceani TaxID=2843216 RepID=UPI001C3E748B|nr:helix-turn-helix domain-containing protein [Miltoncostaea oceani]
MSHSEYREASKGGRAESGASEHPGWLRISVELSDEDVRRIADQMAALLRTEPRGIDRESPYLTIDEAAAYLRCRRQRIDDLLSQRRLSRIKDGARTLIARAELEAYLRRGADDPSLVRWGSAA